MRKFILKLVLPIFVFIVGVLIASIFSPTPINAQACTTPAQVSKVLVSYPACDANNFCNFTQATCSWGAVLDAASYSVKATEVDTGTIVYNQSVAATVSNVIFSITQGKTYKCDVSAVNSCGTAGPASTHSLLCEADAAITTTPTIPPPTPTLVVKPVVPPPPGAPLWIMTTGIAFAFLIVGTFLFVL